MKQLIICFLLCCTFSCTTPNNKKSEILCACYIFSIDESYPHIYLEINNAGIITTTVGEPKANVEKRIYNGEELNIGANFYIETDTTVIGSKTVITSSSINTNGMKILKTKMEDIKKCKPNHIFVNPYSTNESAVAFARKHASDGVILFVNGKQYMFWSDEATKEERKLFEIIDSFAPVKLHLKHENFCL